MFTDLAINLAASAIYDFGKALLNAADKTEMVQLARKKLGAVQHLHDFPDRYLEALVELRFEKKPKVVLNFFRDESIMQAFFDYYYGSIEKRGNDSKVAEALAHCLASLKVGEDVVKGKVNVEAEVQHFWDIFRQKVQESRTVKEAEWMHILEEQKRRLSNIEDLIQEFRSPLRAPHLLTAAGASPPSGFLGREQELQQIHTLLQSSENILLVNAEGGMGKTSLAAKYWADFGAHYQHCAWIFCASPILAEMQDKLAQPLGLKDYFDQEADAEKRLAALKSAMAQLAQPCLLVLDNANDPDHIHDFLTYMSGLNWRVLFTSRCEGVLSNRDAEIKITGLPPALAKELFKRNYDEGTLQFETLLDRFLRAVDYNTLCIDIFSKNLREAQGWGDDMAAFLHKLETRGLLLNEQSFAITTDYAQTNAAGRILRSSDEIIEVLYNFAELDEAQSNLLIRLALLPAETHAPEVLKTLLADGNPIQLGKQLAELSRKGWLATEPGNAYRLSPVVQKAVLQKHRAVLWPQAEPMIKLLIELFEHEGYHPKNIEIAAPYANLIFGMADLLQVAQKDLSTLYNRLWAYYSAVGNLSKALNCAKRKLDLDEKIDNKNYIAISYGKLGETQAMLGNLNEALKLFEEANQLFDQLLSISPQNVEFKNGLAISYEKLGSTHKTLGNLMQALGFFEKFNQLEKELHRAFPQNVEFTNGLAISYEKLGSIYRAMGNLKEALKFLEEETQLFEELCSTSPQNVESKNGLAISYSQLGSTHTELGNLKEALVFFEQSSQLIKELHSDFPKNVGFKKGLAISYEKLGATHSALGNLMPTLFFFEQDNQLAKELYSNSPKSMEFKNLLAISYLFLGQFHRDQGKDMAQAKENIRRGFELYDQLVKEFPDHVAFKGNYEEAKNDLAALG